MSKKYIHYGSSTFDINRFRKIENICLGSLDNKPYGGLWASPVECNSSWYNWCLNNDYKPEKLKESFTFTLKPGTNILKLNSTDDVYLLNKFFIITKPLSRMSFIDTPTIDFEYLEKVGYDGLEISMDDYDMYMKFYGWDVDSLLLFNPNCIDIC